MARNIVYAAFGLLSLLGIIGAGYALVSMPGTPDFSSIAVAVIAVSVAIVLGFYAVSQIAILAC